MTTRLAAAAFIPMCLAASLAFAQTQPPSAEGRERSGEPSQPRADAVPVLVQARSHADADARTCLDFVTNIGVMRCAEKYRQHSGVPVATHR